MSAPESTTLQLEPRDPEGSRTARRLRRAGQVPGVIYGTGAEPLSFSVDARILRNTLAHSGAILQVSVGDATTVPVLVKDIQRHPVRGEVMHLDLLRVNMSKPIQAPVTLVVVGGDDAPGVSEGGILTQELRELQIEALPGDIPDSIEFDVSTMEMNATATLAELKAPAGITFLDDPETLVATITPPTTEAVEGELETETELVGATGASEAQAQGDTAEEAAASEGGGDADAS
jgi:large subunit ribosomal protein L25